MFENLRVRPVTILSGARSTDRYNDTIVDWSLPTETCTKAWIGRTSATEDRDHRDAADTTITMFFDAGTVITALDRVLSDDGLTYEVVGEPNVAWTPRGPHHVETVLRVVVG